MPVEELNVVLLVTLSKLVDEVPSFARLAVNVPPVTAMLALTPLLVSIATVRPESVFKVDLLLAELPSAFVVLPVPPLKVISVVVEPSPLIVLTTWVVMPLEESVEAGIVIIAVPSLPIFTSEPSGAFTFAEELPELFSEAKLTVIFPSALILDEILNAIFPSALILAVSDVASENSL
jgi:hypothetical protein